MGNLYANWYSAATLAVTQATMSLPLPTTTTPLTTPVLTLSTPIVTLASGVEALGVSSALGLMGAVTVVWVLVARSASPLFLTSLLAFGEKELNAIDDLVFTATIVVVFFFMNFYGCLAVLNWYSYGFNAITVGVVLTLLLVSIPSALVYNFGFYAIINIRGSATTLSYIYELILDYVNLTSYFLRLCIQLVRVVVIGVTYFLYNELFFEYLYSGAYHTLTLGGAFQTYARLVFEIGHTFLIFGIQFVAFSVMILWLFQFLFTLFFAETLEYSFTSRTTN